MFGWLKRSTAPIVVEEYRIEPSETEGFQKVILRFQDAKNRIYRFELHPAQAHYFSDELLRSTARAIALKDDVG
jgi:hypothetical protein